VIPYDKYPNRKKRPVGGEGPSIRAEGWLKEVAIPTAVTRRTLDDTDAGRHLIVCQDADDMFAKLGI